MSDELLEEEDFLKILDKVYIQYKQNILDKSPIGVRLTFEVFFDNEDPSSCQLEEGKVPDDL